MVKKKVVKKTAKSKPAIKNKLYEINIAYRDDDGIEQLRASGGTREEAYRKSSERLKQHYECGRTLCSCNNLESQRRSLKHSTPKEEFESHYAIFSGLEEVYDSSWTTTVLTLKTVGKTLQITNEITIG